MTRLFLIVCCAGLMVSSCGSLSGGSNLLLNDKTKETDQSLRLESLEPISPNQEFK